MSVISKLKVWIGSDTADLEKGLKKSKKEVSTFGSGIKKLGGMIAGAFAVSSVVSFAKEFLGLSKVQADAEKKLGAVIKATGGAAGLTAKEMKKYASQLQDVTTYGDEVTIGAMAIMSTFKSIKGDVFKQAIASAQDMATVLNTDLNAAVMQIGKALEAPEIGLTALRRSGVSFSQEQIKQIKKLVAEGKKQEAQLIMLKELQNEFGGAAKAAAGDAYGAATQLENAWGDLKEAIGAAITPSIESINSLKQATLEVTDVINDENIPAWRKWLGMILPFLSQRNKAEAYGNKLMQQTNEETIKSLKLSELDINALLGKQNIYRELNRTQNNYFKQTYDAISAELKKRAAGIEAITEEQKKAQEEAAQKIKAEQEKKQAIQDTIDMEEKSIEAIGKKVKAFQTLKAATDITDQASLDYYNKEIARLNTLIKKTDELSQKRILAAKKRTDGKPVEKRDVYGGLVGAAIDIEENTLIPEDLAQLPDKLAPCAAALQKMQTDFIDLSEIAKTSMAEVAENFGAALGEIVVAGGSFKDLANMAGSALGDVVTAIGKATIAAGAGAIAIKAALKLKNPYAAIAAGAALVALGAALKASLGKIADGGTAPTFSSHVLSGSGVTDTRTTTGIDNAAKPVEVIVRGDFKLRGSTLVAAVESENARKKITT